VKTILVEVITYDQFENNNGPILRISGRNESGKRIYLDVQDEKLSPRFFIRLTDLDLFKEVVEDKGLDKLITRYSDGLPTALDEDTICIHTKYSRHIKQIREGIGDIPTFNADIKWEKMVFQTMKWKQFLEVDSHDPYSFTKLRHIHPSEKVFKMNHNICYWDIETNHSQIMGIKNNTFLYAAKVPIISYVVYSKFKEEYTYYAWKKEWVNREYRENHMSNIGKDILNTASFKNYNTNAPVTVKLFNDETLMHSSFIDDFSKGDYDGVMTFNGRGGNVIFRGKRQWNNGYDMPLFYNRCIHLGLEEELQKMSPIPSKKYSPSVKPYIQYKKGTFEVEKYEIFIKCVPQHDLLYDDKVLFYSKEAHEMKRHRLEDFMNHFLNSGKVKHEGEMVWELFDHNWEEEKHYNIVDVEGMVALDILFDYTDDVAGRSLLFGGKIEDGVYASKVHDHINLWFTSNEYVMDTRGNRNRSTWKGLLDRKVGGFNLEPVPGIYGYFEKRYGIIIDFSKLYPTCTMTANADLRTKVNLDHMELTPEGWYLVDTVGRRFLWDDCARSPAGFFRKDIISLNTVIYKVLISERNVYERKMTEYDILKGSATSQDDIDFYDSMAKIMFSTQFSYKGLINGKFGADGLKSTRNYDFVIYNTPPSMGQILIKIVISTMKDLGYEPLLASTDSALCMVNANTPEEAWAIGQEMCRLLNEEILPPIIHHEFNPIESYIKIGCEKVFDVAIIMDKRRYILNTVVKEKKGGGFIVLEKPEPYFRGIEYLRRDAAMITHDVQETLIKMTLERKDQEEVFNYFRKIDAEYMDYPWSYICGRSGISMGVGDGSGQKYDACENANNLLEKEYAAGANPLLGIFTKFPRVYNGHNLSGKKWVMAFDDWDEYPLKKKGFDLDYYHTKETHLTNKVDPFLELIYGKNYKQIVSDIDGIYAI